MERKREKQLYEIDCIALNEKLDYNSEFIYMIQREQELTEI